MTHFRPDRTNITVNYEGMNFGQSVAYGALGSLTGGGCGINSVWQMSGYPYMAGGCCSSSNSQILGNVIYGGINTLFQCVQSYHSDRKEAKAANEKEVATAKSNVKALDKEIAALKSEQNALDVNIDTETDLSGVKKYLPTQYNAYDSAKTAFDAFQNGTDTYSRQIANLENIKNENPNAEEKIKALKLEQATEKGKAETAFDSAKKALSKAISERNAEITEQLETKTNDRDEAQEIIDEAKTTSSSSSSKQLQKAEKAAVKAEAKQAKEEAKKAQEAKEKEEKKLEEKRKAINENFEKAVKAYNSNKKNKIPTEANVIEINKIISEAAFDQQLQESLKKHRNALTGTQLGV